MQDKNFAGLIGLKLKKYGNIKYEIMRAMVDNTEI